MSNPTPPTPPLPFTNPFLTGKDATSPIIRLNVDIPENEYNYVKLIRPTKGTMVITINRLYHELLRALQARGITDITHRAQFEEFVMNMEVNLNPNYAPVQKQNTNTKPNLTNSNERTNSNSTSLSGTLANLSRSSTGRSPLDPSQLDDRGTTPQPSSSTPQPPNEQSNLPRTSKRKVGRKSTAGTTGNGTVQ